MGEGCRFHLVLCCLGGGHMDAETGLNVYCETEGKNRPTSGRFGEKKNVLELPISIIKGGRTPAKRTHTWAKTTVPNG